MKLGAFSISLAVKDLNKSKAFYEALGFSQFGGELSQGYLIMKNESTIIGLFQGMFENNLMTFNPGWNENAEPLSSFDDVREIKNQLQQVGIDTGEEINEERGPASFTVVDPDGNCILFDQHV